MARHWPPYEDYVIDEELRNQIRFINHKVGDTSVIQILTFYGECFERTIIKGSDYLAFHASQG